MQDRPPASDGAAGRVSRYERDRLRAEVLEAADITCTTLSFSGSAAFTRLARKFDAVVIDEAAQVSLQLWMHTVPPSCPQTGFAGRI